MRVRCAYCRKQYDDRRDPVHVCPMQPDPTQAKHEMDDAVEEPTPQSPERQDTIPVVSPKDARVKLEEFLDGLVYALREANTAPPPEDVKAVMDELIAIVKTKPTKVGLIAMGSVLRMAMRNMEGEIAQKQIPFQPGSNAVN